MVDSKWFVRKLGFGLRPEEKFPTDPVNWVINQMDSVPDAVGIRTIVSESKPEIVAWPSTLEWPLKGVTQDIPVTGSQYGYIA